MDGDDDDLPPLVDQPLVPLPASQSSMTFTFSTNEGSNSAGQLSWVQPEGVLNPGYEDATPLPIPSTASFSVMSSAAHDSAYIPRPPNAFILFRSSFIRNHGGGNGTKISGSLSKSIAGLWHALPPAERKLWEDRAEEAREEHRRLYPDWRFRPGQGSRRGTYNERGKNGRGRGRGNGRGRGRRPRAKSGEDEESNSNGNGKQKGKARAARSGSDSGPSTSASSEEYDNEIDSSDDPYQYDADYMEDYDVDDSDDEDFLPSSTRRSKSRKPGSSNAGKGKQKARSQSVVTIWDRTASSSSHKEEEVTPRRSTRTSRTTARARALSTPDSRPPPRRSASQKENGPDDTESEEDGDGEGTIRGRGSLTEGDWAFPRPAGGESSSSPPHSSSVTRASLAAAWDGAGVSGGSGVLSAPAMPSTSLASLNPNDAQPPSLTVSPVPSSSSVTSASTSDNAPPTSPSKSKRRRSSGFYEMDSESSAYDEHLDPGRRTRGRTRTEEGSSPFLESSRLGGEQEPLTSLFKRSSSAPPPPLEDELKREQTRRDEQGWGTDRMYVNLSTYTWPSRPAEAASSTPTSTHTPPRSATYPDYSRTHRNSPSYMSNPTLFPPITSPTSTSNPTSPATLSPPLSQNSPTPSEISPRERYASSVPSPMRMQREWSLPSPSAPPGQGARRHVRTTSYLSPLNPGLSAHMPYQQGMGMGLQDPNYARRRGSLQIGYSGSESYPNPAAGTPTNGYPGAVARRDTISLPLPPQHPPNYPSGAAGRDAISISITPQPPYDPPTHGAPLPPSFVSPPSSGWNAPVPANWGLPPSTPTGSPNTTQNINDGDRQWWSPASTASGSPNHNPAPSPIDTDVLNTSGMGYASSENFSRYAPTYEPSPSTQSSNVTWTTAPGRDGMLAVIPDPYMRGLAQQPYSDPNDANHTPATSSSTSSFSTLSGWAGAHSPTTNFQNQNRDSSGDATTSTSASTGSGTPTIHYSGAPFSRARPSEEEDGLGNGWYQPPGWENGLQPLGLGGGGGGWP